MSERASHRCCRLSALFGASACQVRNGGSTSVYFVLVSSSFSNRVQRPQVCNAGLDLVLAPAFGHTADVHQAITCRGNPLRHELSPVGVRSTTVLAYPSRRPDDPTVHGPRLLGPWRMGTGGKPCKCAVLKDFVGEAPPFRSGVSLGKKVRNDNRKLAGVCCTREDVHGAGTGSWRGRGGAVSGGVGMCVFIRPEISVRGARAEWCARVRADGRARAQSWKLF